MHNSHMCTIAIVMATCVYEIYFWWMSNIGYSLVLLFKHNFVQARL